MKKLNIWGPWSDNPSKSEYIYNENHLNESFEKWYQENKDSGILQEEYGEICFELETMGDEIPSFKKWCKEKYEWLKEYESLDESTKLEPNLGGEIDMDTHKLLDKDEDKDDDELKDFDKEITESANIDKKYIWNSGLKRHDTKKSEDPYEDILKDLK